MNNNNKSLIPTWFAVTKKSIIFNVSYHIFLHFSGLPFTHILSEKTRFLKRSLIISYRLQMITFDILTCSKIKSYTRQFQQSGGVTERFRNSFVFHKLWTVWIHMGFRKHSPQAPSIHQMRKYLMLFVPPVMFHTSIFLLCTFVLKRSSTDCLMSCVYLYVVVLR